MCYTDWHQDKGPDKMGRNDYIRYIEQALQRATPEQLTKIYRFLHALLGGLEIPEDLFLWVFFYIEQKMFKGNPVAFFQLR